MSDLAISPFTPLAAAHTDDRDPARVHDAAQQFESLLLGQMLRSVRESGAGWLGEEDNAGESATDMAEQQFATVMAQQGGLGLADLITRGLS